MSAVEAQPSAFCRRMDCLNFARVPTGARMSINAHDSAIIVGMGDLEFAPIGQAHPAYDQLSRDPLEEAMPCHDILVIREFLIATGEV